VHVVVVLGPAELTVGEQGTPWLSSSVVMKFRCRRNRSALIVASVVSPSAPLFQDRLWLSPSRPPSPLSALCFSLYETRSRRVKPSWATMKLIDAVGRRSEWAYRSLEPVSREANSARLAASPRQ
jgi:hypothetical protein